MNLSEQLRQAREAQGLSQEALAERLNLSRQSISKWELGASVPTRENMEALSEVLGLDFTSPPEAPQGDSRIWKPLAEALAALLILAALSAFMYVMFFRAPPPDPSPAITGVYFYDGTGAPLPTEAGWHALPSGETVITAVTFDTGTDPEQYPYAAVLYLTPSGTETFEERQQLALRSIGDGESGLVLFTWEVPQDLMDHMEVVLECVGGQTYTEYCNVAVLDR